MKICNGATRKVFIIGKWAYKIPQVKSWRNFLNGLLANMQEVSFSQMKDSRMCPIRFHIPGGWLVVMPKCIEISSHEFENLPIDEFWEQEYKVIGDQTIYYGDCVVPVEQKRNSFGWYQGKIVAIDYGN